MKKRMPEEKTKNSTENPFSGLRKSERGMILIVTLWILAIMSLLLVVIFTSSDLNVRQSSALKRESVAAATARAAVYAVARKLLEAHKASTSQKGASAKKQNSSKNKTQKHTTSESHELIRGEELGFYLVEAGKNLDENEINRWQVSRYKAATGKGDDWLYRNYAVCLVTAEDSKADIDKLKGENLSKIPGVGKDIAAEISKFIKKSNGGLSCVEELLALGKVQGEMYDGNPSSPGLKDFLTVFSSGKLYINRASAEAITAVLGIDIKKARSIADELKNSNYFMSINSLERLSGVSKGDLQGKVSLICCSYRIKVFAVIQGHMKKLEAVIILDSDKTFTIAYMGNI